MDSLWVFIHHTRVVKRNLIKSTKRAYMQRSRRAFHTMTRTLNS